MRSSRATTSDSFWWGEQPKPNRVKRVEFLELAAGAALIGAAGRDVSIPVEMRGGRFFAVPRTFAGKVFACWLDTNGSGFVFDAAVERFELTGYQSSGKRFAMLPRFERGYDIPELVGTTGLPIFERSASDRADPILQGFDAQLGRTWFAGRVWRFDFVRGSLTLLTQTASPQSGGVPLFFAGGYPYVRVRIEERTVAMSVDTAASVAYKPANTGEAIVSAASFIRRAAFERWRASHPQWRVERNVAVTAGIDQITVPRLHVGTTEFADVAFTTRPGDDVFEGEPHLDGKLGSNAFHRSLVLIDYPKARIWFR